MARFADKPTKAVLDGTELFPMQDGTDDGNALPSAISAFRKVQSIVSAATVTPNASDDLVVISAQAAALSLANPAGTRVEGQGFVIRLKDNGTSRAISFDTDYREMGATFPAATTIGKWLYIPVVYNETDDVFDVLPATEQA